MKNFKASFSIDTDKSIKESDEIFERSEMQCGSFKSAYNKLNAMLKESSPELFATRNGINQISEIWIDIEEIVTEPCQKNEKKL